MNTAINRPITPQTSRMTSAPVADQDDDDDLQARFAELYKQRTTNERAAPTLQGPGEAYSRAVANQALDAMAGRTPSVADAQVRQSTDDSIARQYAVARTMRGPASLIAARNAANAGALERQRAIATAGELRAKEQAAAMGMGLQASGQMLDAARTNLESQLRTRGYNDEEAYRLASLMMEGKNQELRAAEIRAKEGASNNDLLGNLLNLGGQTLPLFL